MTEIPVIRGWEALSACGEGHDLATSREHPCPQRLMSWPDAEPALMTIGAQALTGDFEKTHAGADFKTAHRHSLRQRPPGK